MLSSSGLTRSESSSATSFRQAVLGLVPVVRKRAAEAERQRALPAETIQDLRELGLFRAFVARAYGGDERAPSEVFEAMTELAAGCASTAWVGSLVASHSIAVCWLAEEGQGEIFATGPDVVVSSSVAPSGTLAPVAGGFRLGGRWGYSSGVDHAAWIMLGANLRVGRPSMPPEYCLCFVRATDAKRIDDWHVAGLRATGSKSLELRDIFVPSYRVLVLRTVREGSAPGLALHANALYRLSWESVFISALPPAALGTAIATLEGFREYISSRVDRFTGRPFRFNAAATMRMAEAAAQIDAARLLYRRDVASLDQLVQEGTPLLPGNAERISYDAPFVVDACARAVVRLFRGSGARAVHESSPLQRHFRDICAMTLHAAMDADSASEVYGRVLLQNPKLSLGVRL